MDGTLRVSEECPKLLDLIPKDKAEWYMKRARSNTTQQHGEEDEGGGGGSGLELRLGLPGENSYLNLTSPHKKSSPYNNEMVDMKTDKNNMAFSTASSPANTAATATATNTAVPNSSQKRNAPAPVVGWPPIRSLRKNLASSSQGKQVSESQNGVANKNASEKPVECSGRKGMFVKINMDGIPIGRKVDLKAYHSYDKLSTAVDELFRGLLAAQKDSSAGGIHNKQEEEKPISGLLDGRGEYTLVYEDFEGDRMLVGDVPWQMFVSTVKRLRVLKTTDLNVMNLGGRKQGKMPT